MQKLQDILVQMYILQRSQKYLKIQSSTVLLNLGIQWDHP